MQMCRSVSTQPASFKLKFSVLFAIYKVMTLLFYLYFRRVYSLGFNYLRIRVVCVCVGVGVCIVCEVRIQIFLI